LSDPIRVSSALVKNGGTNSREWGGGGPFLSPFLFVFVLTCEHGLRSRRGTLAFSVHTLPFSCSRSLLLICVFYVSTRMQNCIEYVSHSAFVVLSV